MKPSRCGSNSNSRAHPLIRSLGQKCTAEQGIVCRSLLNRVFSLGFRKLYPVSASHSTTPFCQPFHPPAQGRRTRSLPHHQLQQPPASPAPVACSSTQTHALRPRISRAKTPRADSDCPVTRRIKTINPFSSCPCPRRSGLFSLMWLLSHSGITSRTDRNRSSTRNLDCSWMQHGLCGIELGSDNRESTACFTTSAKIDAEMPRWCGRGTRLRARELACLKGRDGTGLGTWQPRARSSQLEAVIP